MPSANLLTVSISRETLEYLEARRAGAHAPLMSAYFETPIRDLQSKADMEKMEANMVAYYDSLGTTEMEEESDWGRIGAASLPQYED